MNPNGQPPNAPNTNIYELSQTTPACSMNVPQGSQNGLLPPAPQSLPYQDQISVNSPEKQDRYQSNIDTKNKFDTKTKFNDVWAAVLFFVHLVGFAVLSYFVLHNSKTTLIKLESSGFGNYHNFIGFGIAGVTAAVLAIFYIFLMHIAPKLIIYASLCFIIIYVFATGAFMIMLNRIVPGVLLFGLAALYAFLVFSWRDKIQFTSIVLKSTTSFTRRYPGIMLIGFIFMLLSLSYTFCWAFTFMTLLRTNYMRNCTLVSNFRGTKYVCENSPGLYGVYFFFALSLSWTTQLFKDIYHITISGTFAADYFFPSTTSAPSKFTSFSSLGRALTTSFGSACFGSFILAIINAVKSTLDQAAHDSDNMFAAILACCAVCLLGCLESLMEYFNSYAYVYCAIYGLSYIQAGRATWNLIKDRGVEAIINDAIIDKVLFMGIILISTSSVGVSFGYVYTQNPNMGILDIVFVVLISFVLAVLISSVVLQAISSATTAFFVCLAEDPQVLASYNQELFYKIQRSYPEVVCPL